MAGWSYTIILLMGRISKVWRKKACFDSFRTCNDLNLDTNMNKKTYYIKVGSFWGAGRGLSWSGVVGCRLLMSKADSIFEEIQTLHLEFPFHDHGGSDAEIKENLLGLLRLWSSLIFLPFNGSKMAPHLIVISSMLKPMQRMLFKVIADSSSPSPWRHIY